MMYHFLFAFFYLLSLLPFWILFLFSDFTYLILYKIIGYRISVVRKNLTDSFPEKNLEEIKQIERKFYRHLCDYLVETIKMLTMSEQQMRRHMLLSGTDQVNACINEGQSCVIYIGHSFNWEWITSLPLWLSDKAHCGQLYHALENKAFDKLFLKLRERWGSESIPLTNILRKTVEAKRKKQATVIGYLGDQVPHWNNIHHWCWFLNHDTPVMTGTERIAIKNHQALFFLEISCKKRGYYEGDLKLMTRNPEMLKEFEATDMYFQLLEANILRQPELWLWSHNRWKRTREEFNRRFKVVNGKVIQISED